MEGISPSLALASKLTISLFVAIFLLILVMASAFDCIKQWAGNYLETTALVSYLICSFPLLFFVFLTLDLSNRMS